MSTLTSIRKTRPERRLFAVTGIRDILYRLIDSLLSKCQDYLTATMSGIVGRLPSITESGSGDLEKDANSVLMELDKGLRSVKVGEQCEAIVRFPTLFEKYPFPIVINSSFLKLGDVFRVGSNLLRLCILRITQQSRKHLNKILNVDEFLRKIFSVIHSNDPVARAITLRVLGSAASLLSDRKKIHHSIIVSLESHDQVEVEAAIFASRCFSAQSKVFAVSVVDQLSDVIMRLSTPIDMKLMLLPVMQHMYYEPATATKVRELGMKLLTDFPSLRFVLTTLHTLSLLSAKSLTDIPQQVTLLQDHLVNDTRLAVKALCLRDLALLSITAPHMWQSDNIQVLCKFATENTEEKMVVGSMKVLNKLAHSIAVAKFSTSDDSLEMQCITQTCYHSNIQIASLGTNVLVCLAIHQNKVSVSGEDFGVREQACIALETLLSMLSTHDDKDGKLKQVSLLSLRCAVELCQAVPALTDRFIDSLCTILPQLKGDWPVMFYECLLAICSQHNDLLPGLMPEVLKMLEQNKHNKHAVLSLSTLLFQGSVDDGLSGEVSTAVTTAVGVCGDGWLTYRLARQATRYGHHALATQLFAKLTSEVSSEQNYYWLSGLRECSQAEDCLMRASEEHSTSVPHLMQSLTVALNHYHQCRASLRAATTQEFSQIFQLEYVRLRIKMLDSFVSLLHGCCSFRTSPPPATATALATTTGLDIHKCGHVLSQLKTCVSNFTEVYQDYVELYHSAFNADASSLANIQILQQMSLLMIQVLEYVMTSSQQTEVTTSSSLVSDDLGEDVGGATEYQRWLSARHQVKQILQNITDNKEPSNTLTYKHLQCIEQTMTTLCSVPLCLPRFFFQKLQHTKIKLALSPQQKSSNEPISVHYDTCLTLKVEGVIESGTAPKVKGQPNQGQSKQHVKKRSDLRRVSQVKLKVKTMQVRRGEVINEGKYPESHSNSLTQVTTPHSDYFCSQIILAFPIPGIHQVTIDTEVVDEAGIEWKTGPSVSVQVKSYDEAVQRQQQQQYAAQRQQQRAALAAASTASTSQF